MVILVYGMVKREGQGRAGKDTDRIRTGYLPVLERDAEERLNNMRVLLEKELKPKRLAFGYHFC